MGNIKDLTGQTFGYLTAIEATSRRYHGSAVWRCRCICGKIVEKSAGALTAPNSNPSCGCQRVRHKPGERYGRLVTVRCLSTKKCKKPEWILRCDCGNLTIRPIWSKNDTMQPVKSCGCLSRGTKSQARCPACGKYFPIVLDGTPTPQFCPDCTPKYAGQAWRVCPVCTKLFPAPPSSTATTCSKACYSAWRSRIQINYSNPWSDEAKARLSSKGQTRNLKLGVEAAKKSPIAGRSETNQMAKIWVLISPTGEEIIVQNLHLWAGEHTDLFGKPPGDKSAKQIASGFRAIARTLTGKRTPESRGRPAYSYFGWSLKEPPKIPEKPEVLRHSE